MERGSQEILKGSGTDSGGVEMEIRGKSDVFPNLFHGFGGGEDER